MHRPWANAGEVADAQPLQPEGLGWVRPVAGSQIWAQRIPMQARRGLRMPTVSYRLGNFTLILAASLIFSGLERFLVVWSPVYHYAFDVVVLMAIAVSTVHGLSRQSLPTGGYKSSIFPYQLWIVFYFLWGLVVLGTTAVASRAFSDLILNLLITTSVVLALRGKRDVTVLAGFFQVAAIGNVALQLFELSQPQLISQLALALNPAATAFNVQRPAGLWANPNEAAIALLFAFLLAHWCIGPLKWFGRLASVVGIFLTASRGGMYPLVLCMAVLVFVRLRHLSARPKNGFLIAGAGALALPVVLLFGWVTLSSIQSASTLDYALVKLADVTQATQGQVSDPTRLSVAAEYFSKALRGPVQGSGVYSFQGQGLIQGAHDIYITVWGEVGFVGLVIYLAVLLVGASRAFDGRLPARDRVTLILMWLSYALVGLVWHNQFSSVVGITVASLLFSLPGAVRADQWTESITRGQLSVETDFRAGGVR